MSCKICLGETKELAEVLVLKRYKVKYYKCLSCGFVQTEEPYWLAEAYKEPIVKSDTGLIGRNIRYARVVLALIQWGGLRGPVLDHAGGYGLLTRILCDHGIDADWYDPFCENLFAIDHVYNTKKKYQLVTAFESLEHQIDPVKYLKDLLAISSTVLISMEILPMPCPMPEDWWYYNPEAGQHISFFTKKSLKLLAQQLNVHCVSWQGLHFFSKQPSALTFFRLLTSDLAAKFFNRLY